jgi:hypothetical protein
MRLETAGRMRLCMLNCDMGRPEEERRSIRDRSNLYNCPPRGFSDAKAAKYQYKTSCSHSHSLPYVLIDGLSCCGSPIEIKCSTEGTRVARLCASNT